MSSGTWGLTSGVARCFAVGLLLAASMVLADCGGDPSALLISSPPAGISAVFDEIYDGDFDKNNAGAPYDKFDIIYVAFAHIDPITHRLDFETKVGKDIERQRLEILKANTQALRAAGKLKLVISLGWGEQEAIGGVPLIEIYIDTVAPSVRQFVEQNGLDGFDIDYEFPQFTSTEKFMEVAVKIRAALGPDYLFTITPNNTTNLDGATLNTYFDYVNAQSYNAQGDLTFSVSDLLDLGVSASKVLAGADIENINLYNNDQNRVAWAINQYQSFALAGVFIWQMKPPADQFPGGTFQDYANEVWNATQPETGAAQAWKPLKKGQTSSDNQKQ